MKNSLDISSSIVLNIFNIMIENTTNGKENLIEEKVFKYLESLDDIQIIFLKKYFDRTLVMKKGWDPYIKYCRDYTISLRDDKIESILK